MTDAQALAALNSLQADDWTCSVIWNGRYVAARYTCRIWRPGRPLRDGLPAAAIGHGSSIAAATAAAIETLTGDTTPTERLYG